MSTAPMHSSRQLNVLWGGINITQEVLNVQSAISSPTCAATSNCTEFVQWIPQCLSFGSSEACWCANPSPLHFCSICMSSPLNAETSAEQTQLAGQSHEDYHTGCGAYFAFINGTSSSSSTIASTTASSSSSSTSTVLASEEGSHSSVGSGAVAGIIVAGLIALALIICGAWLLYRNMQNKHEEKAIWGSMGESVATPFLMNEVGGMTLVPEQANAHGGATSSPPPFQSYSPMPTTTPQGGRETPSYASVVGDRSGNSRDSYDTSMLSDVHGPGGIYR